MSQNIASKHPKKGAKIELQYANGAENAGAHPTHDFCAMLRLLLSVARVSGITRARA
jgi:hypothetical protein